MPRFVCDACDRQFDAPDARPGDKVACPHCGDIHRVHAVGVPVGDGSGPGGAERGQAGRTGPGDAVDRAAAMGLPPDSGPEQNVLFIRPAMARARPLLFLGLMVAMLGGLGGAAAAAAGAMLPLAGGLAAVAVAGAVGLAVWKVACLGESLRVTNKRVIWTRGLLSRSTSEVAHDRIQNIQIRQSFWNRLWGVGEVGISSAGQSDMEILVANVPGPYRLQQIIDAYRPM